MPSLAAVRVYCHHWQNTEDAHAKQSVYARHSSRLSIDFARPDTETAQRPLSGNMEYAK